MDSDRLLTDQLGVEQDLRCAIPFRAELVEKCTHRIISVVIALCSRLMDGLTLMTLPSGSLNSSIPLRPILESPAAPPFEALEAAAAALDEANSFSSFAGLSAT
jgi:hypothetical protein